MPGEVLLNDALKGNTLAKPHKYSSKPDFHLISSEDVVYEQDILRNPGSIKPWLAYIEFKSRYGTLLERAFVLERACTELPRSYKLWKMYLLLRENHLNNLHPILHATEFAKVNSLYERALILLNKMPRIWQMFLSFLMKQPLITYTRRTFDRALRALPITQHNRIWALFRVFADAASGKTAITIWRRYMQVHPEDGEGFIEFLVEQEQYTEAVKKYVDILNNPRFRSRHGKSQFQLWTEMVDLMVAHAKEIQTGPILGVDVDRIVRSGIDRFADQRGRLWVGLATFWITRGDFDRARDVYEEGITSVMTVRDFTLIFDSYTEFEESIIALVMDAAEARSAKGIANEEEDFDLDIRLIRFEQLMDRRPFLLNDVVLRQDPNNVNEWEKRVGLWGENKKEVVQTYTDAIAAINPKKAVGKFHQLWVNYAKLYEKGGDLATARVILDKAVKVPFKSVAELADTWCEWAEMELRHKNMDKAVEIMAKATQAPVRSTVDYFDETLSAQQRVHKSSKLWSFYVDLIESVGSLGETRNVYDRIFELRIATPQTVVNYARYLEEHDYIEDMYKIYERGIELFNYPVAFELWNLYLSKALAQRIDMDRLRDLFEYALEGCPPKYAKPLYIMYSSLEETRGMAATAARIWSRAVKGVSDEDRFAMFEYYIGKMLQHFGPDYARPIYQDATEALPDSEARVMALKFAQMERRLGAIDRARYIYIYGSQFCDPRTIASYWATWEAFEVKHGNEDTFKEMLRIKRSVQAKFNTDVHFVASQAIARSQAKGDDSNNSNHQTGANKDDATTDERADAMAALERQARAPQGFVPASTGPEGGTRAASTSQKAAMSQDGATAPVRNPDAIDIDEMVE